jgi:subtilase family serine protease
MAARQQIHRRILSDRNEPASTPPTGLVCQNALSACGGKRLRRKGWYTVRGTSCSAPQFAAMVAIADQIAGHSLGQINPTLYQLASSDYGKYFYDVTTGNNGPDPSVPGYNASTGWDPVTGLGTPDAANLVPALAAG